MELLDLFGVSERKPGSRRGSKNTDAAKAVNTHLDRLCKLQKQLARGKPPYGCWKSGEGTCLCQQLPKHTASLLEAAAAYGPMDTELVLGIIRVLGSLGAVLLKGSHPLYVTLAAVQALHSAAIIPAQQVMHPIVYRSHFTWHSDKSPNEVHAEVQQLQGGSNIRFMTLLTHLPQEMHKCGAHQALATATNTHKQDFKDINKMLCKLKTLQALARSTQQHIYATQAQLLAADVSKQVAAIHGKCQQVQCLYAWTTTALAAWPLPPDEIIMSAMASNACGSRVGTAMPLVGQHVALLAAAQLQFLTLLVQVSRACLQDSVICGSAAGTAGCNSSSGGFEGHSETGSTPDSSSGGSSSSGSSSSGSSDGSSSGGRSLGQLPALDASTAAKYRPLLSAICDMMCSGLCSTLPRRHRSSLQLPEMFDIVMPALAQAKSSPGPMLLLGLTAVHYFGSQLVFKYKQPQQPLLQDGEVVCSASSAASSSSGASMVANAYGCTNSSMGGECSNSSMNGCSSWEAAEALLLQRADLMQSEAESAAHLAAMLSRLRQPGQLYTQYWQKLGLPAWLNPSGPSGSTKSCLCSSTSSAGSSSGCCSSSDMLEKDPSLLFAGLHDALRLLLDFPLQNPGPALATLQSHAGPTTQMLLSAAAAAVGLYGQTAAPLSNTCLTVALALLWSQPCAPGGQGVSSQSRLRNVIRGLVLDLAEMHVQQQGPYQQAGPGLRPPAIPEAVSRQTMGLLLQLLRQLRFAFIKDSWQCRNRTSDSASACSSSSTSMSSKGGTGTSGSSGGGSTGSSAAASASSDGGANVGCSSDSSDSFLSLELDNTVQCMLKSIMLLVYHLEPMLCKQHTWQMADSLHSPQHCEQLAAVYQEIEASLRAIWPLLLNEYDHTHETRTQGANKQPTIFVVCTLMGELMQQFGELLRLPTQILSRPSEALQVPKAGAEQQQGSTCTWGVLSGTVHGQQLLQAGLSLMLSITKATIPSHDDTSFETADPFIEAGKNVVPMLLMDWVSRWVSRLQVLGKDLQAHTRNSSTPEGSGQAHGQQQGQAPCASPCARHLPHPQLVHILLGFAKQHYGQVYRELTTLAGLPDDVLSHLEQGDDMMLAGPEGGAWQLAQAADRETFAALTPGVTAAAPAASSRSTAAASPCPSLVLNELGLDAGYNYAVAQLLQSLVGFAAAPNTELQPCGASW